MTTRLTGLWRHPDFVKLWIGQTISQLGSQGAVGLTALLYLGATPAEMGFLAAAGGIPVVIFSLLAGVGVDRVRRRPLLIASDVGRAGLLSTIPLAAAFNGLTILQLYVVAFLTGILTLVFDLAHRAYVPALVDRADLVDANSKLQMSESASEVAGPAIIGALFQVASAPVAVLVDALSFAMSAAFCASIKRPEVTTVSVEEEPGFLRDFSQGLKEVARSPILRALGGSSAIRAFFGGFIGALYALFAIRELGLSVLVTGLTIGAGGLGSLFGAFIVAPLMRRFGLGMTIIGSSIITGGLAFLIPLASGPAAVAVLFLLASQVLGDPFWAAGDICKMSLRQAITPDRLQGRVNATIHFLAGGAVPLGALASGLLAEAIGVRETLLIAVGGTQLEWVWLLISPVRSLREQPAAAE